MKINPIIQRVFISKTQKKDKNIFFANNSYQNKDVVTLNIPRKDLNLIRSFINSQISQTNLNLNSIEFEVVAKRNILKRLTEQYEIRSINSEITKLNKQHQRLENTFNKLNRMLNALNSEK